MADAAWSVVPRSAICPACPFNCKQKELKITLLGINGSGKTSLVLALQGKHCMIAALGPSAKKCKTTLNLVGEGKRRCVLSDMPGASSERAAWLPRLSAKKSHGVILVVDSCDSLRFPIVQRELGVLVDNGLGDKPLLIVVNKSDSLGATDVPSVAAQLGVARFPCKTWQLHACSAMNGTGVEGILQWLGAAGASSDSVPAEESRALQLDAADTAVDGMAVPAGRSPVAVRIEPIEADERKENGARYW